MYKSNIIGISIGALLLASAVTNAIAAEPNTGMYVLTARFGDEGTCTPSQRIAFSYFAYTSYVAADSELYYFSPTSLKSDIVTFSLQNRNGSKWHGHITWAANPWTFAPPPIQTAFRIKFDFIESRLFNFSGMFEVPLADGSTCTEFVNYRAIRTGG